MTARSLLGIPVVVRPLPDGVALALVNQATGQVATLGTDGAVRLSQQVELSLYGWTPHPAGEASSAVQAPALPTQLNAVGSFVPCHERRDLAW